VSLWAGSPCSTKHAWNSETGIVAPLGVVLFAVGIAAILLGTAWNIRSFRKSRRAATPALRMQAVGAGVSLIGSAMTASQIGAPAGTASVAVAILLAGLGVFVLVLATRIHVQE
jgi:hypothetical protein